jgi:hypothetical protein
MDPIVLAALQKWPNVPACRGWLGLDARGDWYMRDDRTQAAGPFPHSKGSRIVHDKLRQFIQRNYAADEFGCWFFQNGPQRVYVELEATPWIWRLFPSSGATPTLQSHTEQATEFVAAFTDEAGHLFLQTKLGLGLVHSMDMHLAIAPIESGIWPVQESSMVDLQVQFGYQQSPSAFQSKNS